MMTRPQSVACGDLVSVNLVIARFDLNRHSLSLISSTQLRKDVTLVDLFTQPGEFFFAVTGLPGCGRHVASIRDRPPEKEAYSPSAWMGNSSAWRRLQGRRGSRRSSRRAEDLRPNGSQAARPPPRRRRCGPGDRAGTPGPPRCRPDRSKRQESSLERTKKPRAPGWQPRHPLRPAWRTRCHLAFPSQGGDRSPPRSPM